MVRGSLNLINDRDPSSGYKTGRFAAVKSATDKIFALFILFKVPFLKRPSFSLTASSLRKKKTHAGPLNQGSYQFLFCELLLDSFYRAVHLHLSDNRYSHCEMQVTLGPLRPNERLNLYSQTKICLTQITDCCLDTENSSI